MVWKPDSRHAIYRRLNHGFRRDKSEYEWSHGEAQTGLCLMVTARHHIEVDDRFPFPPGQQSGPQNRTTHPATPRPRPGRRHISPLPFTAQRKLTVTRQDVGIHSCCPGRTAPSLHQQEIPRSARRGQACRTSRLRLCSLAQPRSDGQLAGRSTRKSVVRDRRS